MTSHDSPSPSRTFARTAWQLAFAWLALLLLMSTSLAASYAHLGVGNVVAGVAIAAVKTAIVAWWFMHLRTSSSLLRLAALAALLILALLVTLSGLDYRTRLQQPAAVQVPQQIEPLVGDDGAARVVPR